ncbi:MAG: F-type H+-transporting ATPase subunit epsilon [Crocinitomicaceae bacterium]|jgi:F-type H+-transporting ATPase subunit epsilon
MQVEIITPESKIFAGEAVAVQFPGLDGSFQVLSNHAPIISALSGGDLKLDLETAFDATDKTSELIQKDKADNKVIRVTIKGGVMEMLNNKVVILAE